LVLRDGRLGKNSGWCVHHLTLSSMLSRKGRIRKKLWKKYEKRVCAGGNKIESEDQSTLKTLTVIPSLENPKWPGNGGKETSERQKREVGGKVRRSGDGLIP